MRLSDRDLRNNYGEETDEALIIRLRDGEDGIQDYILNKYKNLVKSKAQSMYILGAEPEDLIQEGMIGLFKAIRDYDAGRDASFFTFAELCISRQIYNAVSASGRKKHMPLNSYISIYGEGEGTDKDAGLENTLTDTSENPENLLIDRESVDEIEALIESELSTFEKQTLELFMTGIGYVEISKILGKDEKSTDNALQRARLKLKKCLRKE